MAFVIKFGKPKTTGWGPGAQTNFNIDPQRDMGRSKPGDFKMKPNYSAQDQKGIDKNSTWGFREADWVRTLPTGTDKRVPGTAHKKTRPKTRKIR